MKKSSAMNGSLNGAPHPVAVKILQTALKDVPFDGWSADVMARALAKNKISTQEGERLFPRGIVDLVQCFSTWADNEMLHQLPEDFQDLRVRDRIALAVRIRFMLLSAHKQALSMAMSYMARPLRQLDLTKWVWKTSDVIWQAAGDTATDYNRYTKRLLLSGVVTATTLYWLKDKSENNESTWEFLDRRIENVLKIGKVVGKLKEKVS